MTDVTEFTHLDPEEMHLVKQGASGFPVLLAKAAEDEVEQVSFEHATKGLSWEDAHEYLSKEIGECADEWVLKFVSAADRRKYAKVGVAMPDGSFPIPDEGHLRAAVGRLGNYKGSKSKAKAHIIRRARALGLAHLLPEDWNVSKTVTTAESESQTHDDVESHHAPGSSDAEDGGEPRHVAAEDEHVDTSAGGGDTAPDKTLPKGEASSQTAAKDGMDAGMGGECGPPGGRVEGTGDVAGTGGDAAARAEAGSQTTEVGKAGVIGGRNPADASPGSPAWESKDVALGVQAGKLVTELAGVINTFTEREKAEGGASKALLEEAQGAMRRIAQGLTVLADSNPNVSKEIDVDKDELTKMLDERDERLVARFADVVKEGKKKGGKKPKAGGDGMDGAGTEGGDDAAKGAQDASKAAGQETVEDLRKQLDESNARIEKLEKQPATTPMLNGAGITAAVTGPQASTVMKEMQEEVTKAEEAYKATPNVVTETALRQAQGRLNAAKMIQSEQVRAGDPMTLTRQARGLGVPVLGNSRALPPDPDLRGV